MSGPHGKSRAFGEPAAIIMPKAALWLTVMWLAHLKAEIARKPASLMETVRLCSDQIMARHRSGCTEVYSLNLMKNSLARDARWQAMYQRLLQVELYHRNIPSLAEVDVFTMSGSVPIHVGRLDLEIDHRIILELKVAPKITQKHIQQLQKYVRARISTGMHVEAAAVICWTDRNTVEIYQAPVPSQSPYFRVRLKD